MAANFLEVNVFSFAVLDNADLVDRFVGNLWIGRGDAEVVDAARRGEFGDPRVSPGRRCAQWAVEVKPASVKTQLTLVSQRVPASGWP